MSIVLTLNAKPLRQASCVDVNLADIKPYREAYRRSLVNLQRYVLNHPTTPTYSE